LQPFLVPAENGARRSIRRQASTRDADERHDDVDVVRVVQRGERTSERSLIDKTGRGQVRSEFSEVDTPELS
jgi:hypothetical protein